MKVWKKFSAVALALVMVLALGVSALANEADGDLANDGIVGDFSTQDTPTPEAFTNAVIMYKEITAFNPETSTVNAPTITYTYTIAPGNAGKDIYDAKGKHTPEGNAHVKTKAGVGTPTISGSVDGTTFSNKDGLLALTPSVQLQASASGTDNKFKLKVDFTGIDFTTTGTGAGVYRYVITEHVGTSTTTGADTTAKNAAGINEGTITNVRYMDVYVNGSGEIYGWVCFAYDNSIDARDEVANSDPAIPVANDVVAKAYKTEGFVAGTDSNTNTAVTADEYYTFNFELTKVVEKDNYSATTNPHQFPFTITLANTAVTADVLPIMTFTDDLTADTVNYVNSGASKVTQTALTAAPIAGTWEPTIAHNAAVKYVGIPCGTVVTIKEKNDVSSVTYSAAITHADTNGATKSIFTNEDSSNAVITTTALDNPTANHTKSGGGAVTFTNTMLEISPTGVALRYAPYLAMLGAGVVALPLTLRKKEELF